MKLKWTLAVAALTCTALVTGCDNKANQAVTTSGVGFELSDIGDQTVQQTETDTLTVSIDRKGGFSGEVTVEVSGLPAGVSVDGGNTHVILAKDSSLSLKLMASGTATPSEKNDVRVKASATVDGKSLSKTDNFNLAVRAKS
jgi:hypothetical protein